MSALQGPEDAQTQAAAGRLWVRALVVHLVRGNCDPEHLAADLAVLDTADKRRGAFDALCAVLRIAVAHGALK